WLATVIVRRSQNRIALRAAECSFMIVLVMLAQLVLQYPAGVLWPLALDLPARVGLHVFRVLMIAGPFTLLLYGNRLLLRAGRFLVLLLAPLLLITSGHLLLQSPPASDFVDKPLAPPLPVANGPRIRVVELIFD